VLACRALVYLHALFRVEPCHAVVLSVPVPAHCSRKHADFWAPPFSQGFQRHQRQGQGEGTRVAARAIATAAAVAQRSKRSIQTPAHQDGPGHTDTLAPALDGELDRLRVPTLAAQHQSLDTNDRDALFDIARRLRILLCAPVRRVRCRAAPLAGHQTTASFVQRRP
jgi:hypothetical protein